MQENLVGYLLGALEADEHESVKRQIENSPGLRRKLNALEARLVPLESERWRDYEPPAKLTASTCALVAEIAADSAAIEAHRASPRSGMSPAYEPPRRGASWSFLDMVVTAGIFAAISCLFLPSISQSLDTAKVVACQNNLRELFGGFSQYSAAFDGMYPSPRVQGNEEVMAGLFAPQLVERNFASYQQVVCPTQQGRRTVALRIPTMSATLSELKPQQHKQQQRQQNKSMAALRKVYGYNIGYVDKDDRYQRPRARGRNHVALVADRPVTPYGLANNGHRGRGLNVLMEDGSVKTLPSGVVTIGSDNIFLNDEGRIGPGVDENDSVIGPSVSRLKVLIRVTISPRRSQLTMPIAPANPTGDQVDSEIPSTEL